MINLSRVQPFNIIKYILNVLLTTGLIKNSAILFIGSIVANSFALCGSILIIRLYPIDVVGYFFALVAWGSIFSLILPWGITQTIPLLLDSQLRMIVTLLTAINVITALLGLLFLLINPFCGIVLIIASLLCFISNAEVVLTRDSRLMMIAIIRTATPFFAYTLIALFAITSQNKNLLTVTIAYLLGIMCIVIIYYIKVIAPLLSNLNIKSARNILKDYPEFIKYIGPGFIFHSIAYNLPNIVSASFFSGKTAAIYGLANKFTIAITFLIGQAVGQSYTNYLSKKYRVNDGIKSQDKSLDIVLIILSIIVALIIYFIYPILFHYLFPAIWIDVTKYSIALIPLVIMIISVAPLSNLLQFKKKQKLIMQSHLTSLVISSCAFIIACKQYDFLLGIKIFAIGMSIRYIWLYIQIFMASKI